MSTIIFLNLIDDIGRSIWVNMFIRNVVKNRDPKNEIIVPTVSRALFSS